VIIFFPIKTALFINGEYHYNERIIKYMSISIRFAEKDLPTIIGLDLTGFGLREKSSQGVHDAPMIKCLVIDDGKTQAVSVHCDLLGYNSERCSEVKTEICKIHHIPFENIIISCTHTHSGPASITLIGAAEESDEWHIKAKNTMIECISEALSSEAVTVYPELYKTQISGISYNRVLNSKEHVDKDILTLILREKDSDKINTVLVSFACHPVTTREENYLYSRDYPYYIEREIKEALGEDVNFIFANGCCGDTNPVDQAMSGFEATERTGRAIGKAAIESIKTGGAYKSYDEKISFYSKDIEIPINRKDDEEFLNEFTKITEGLIASAPTKQLAEFYPSYFQWIERSRKRRINGTAEEAYNATVSRICIGGISIVYIPFETFNSIGRNIKRMFGEDKTIVIELGGGNFGYMPSDELYDRASYEAARAFMGYDHPGPVVRSAEYIVYDALKCE